MPYRTEWHMQLILVIRMAPPQSGTISLIHFIFSDSAEMSTIVKEKREGKMRWGKGRGRRKRRERKRWREDGGARTSLLNLFESIE